MPLASMTGYGRAEGADAQVGWTWEARSVNGKSLEIRCRVPAGLDRVESQARALVGRRFKRGSVNLTLTMARGTGALPFRINRELLRLVLHAMEELQREAPVAPPTADGLLRIKGVVEPEEQVSPDPEIEQAREAALLETLDQALQRLGEARLAEGAHLKDVLRQHLARIAALCEAATASAGAQPAALRDRLRRQLADLLGATPPLNEERLAQEVAMLAQKADVREEIDRLRAHLQQAAELLAAAERGEPVGRKFDFLCQEFNREANTLCSKAADIELTRIGIDLKSAIEQMREQVQNVE
ncbi:MAG: YicC/YloC family endoribonuclease [Reyranellaceae bacterium]